MQLNYIYTNAKLLPCTTPRHPLRSPLPKVVLAKNATLLEVTNVLLDTVGADLAFLMFRDSFGRKEEAEGFAQFLHQFPKSEFVNLVASAFGQVHAFPSIHPPLMANLGIFEKAFEAILPAGSPLLRTLESVALDMLSVKPLLHNGPPCICSREDTDELSRPAPWLR